MKILKAKLTSKELLIFEPIADVPLVVVTLRGIFIEKKENEIIGEAVYYPVKIYLNPKRTRYVYFDTQEIQETMYNLLVTHSGQRNIQEYYKFDKTLGQGHFGSVYLASEISSGL